MNNCKKNIESLGEKQLRWKWKLCKVYNMSSLSWASAIFFCNYERNPCFHNKYILHTIIATLYNYSKKMKQTAKFVAEQPHRSEVLTLCKTLKPEKGIHVGRGCYFSKSMHLSTSSVPENNILVTTEHNVESSRVYVKGPGCRRVALLSKTSAHFEHLDKH